ncbi:MAG TPA: 50S ribosomal protein L25 [Rubrobacteraceae bacterium]|nr:50S ribosomal protein L25 [Rubrobacteraceae bacterium]
MADNVDLQAKPREERGKNAARRLRASGMLPAVLYGDGDGSSTALAVPDRLVDYTLHHMGDNALYDIDLGAGGSTARIVDVQRDPVSGRLLHVDFAPVDMLERIEITVPLHVIGEAPGTEEGGVLQQVAYEVQIETLPGDIPQELTLDVSSLGMNENLTLADLRLPDGITLVSDPEEVAAIVTAPTEITEEDLEAAGVVEEEPEEGEEGAEEAEGEEEPAPEEGEGPADQNLQA